VVKALKECWCSCVSDWVLLNMYMMFCSVLFFSRPRSEGWPHHGRTFSICEQMRLLLHAPLFSASSLLIYYLLTCLFSFFFLLNILGNGIWFWIIGFHCWHCCCTLRRLFYTTSQSGNTSFILPDRWSSNRSDLSFVYCRISWCPAAASSSIVVA